MMKTHNNLFDLIVDPNNIYEAYRKARRGKSRYTEVQYVEENLIACLDQIEEELVSGVYRTSEYRISDELKGGKIRTLHKLPFFPDRIVHHCIINILGPRWDRTFIRDTFQSIPGRGTTDCIKRVRKAVQGEDKPKYAIKIDIKKFYPSINPKHLMDPKILRVRCKRTLALLYEILGSTDCLPLGNHTSQYLGNLLLSPLDWKMKQDRGCKYYFRYCDDIVILADSKSELYSHYEYIKEWLSKIGLTVKDPEIVNLDVEYLDFVGVKVNHHKFRLRESISSSFKSKVRSGSSESVSSFRGWTKHSASPNLFNKYVGDNRWKL